jgi:hypothetical protein
VLASALYGAPSQGVLGRDCISGYKIRWIECLERSQ